MRYHYFNTSHVVIKPSNFQSSYLLLYTKNIEKSSHSFFFPNLSLIFHIFQRNSQIPSISQHLVIHLVFSLVNFPISHLKDFPQNSPNLTFHSIFLYNPVLKHGLSKYNLFKAFPSIYNIIFIQRFTFYPILPVLYFYIKTKNLQ